MHQEFLPLEKDAPGRAIMSYWKWIGLGAFFLALIFRPWLHWLFVFLGWVLGIVVLSGLGFRLFRFLKNRLFWRVRNRVIGSFLFVGFLPLLLLAGTAFLASYILAGQLAANYVEVSLGSITAELSSIHAELSPLIVPDRPTAAQDAAAALFERHREKFPKIFARLSRQKPDGNLEPVWTDERKAAAPKEGGYPAARWLSAGGEFEGLLRYQRSVLITTVRPLAGYRGFYLEVSAPLEQSTEQRLAREKSLFAIFEGTGRSSVRENRSGLNIEISNDGGGTDPFDARMRSLDEQRKADSRRMVWWWTLLDAKNYQTGNRDFAAVSVFYVPLEVLYRTYLSGKYNQGEVLLRLIYVLLGLFVAVEVISVFIGAAISRRVTGSIHDMYQGTVALQKGDLQHRIPVRRKDQLGLLAHSFNQMAASMTQLLEEVTEKKRLEQELEIAHEVQATLFPKQLPHAPGLQVFGGCEPARVVSGDYYDFIIEDESLLHIIVGDVSGKGISAALMMANLQAAMRNQLLLFKHQGSGEIGETLAEVMRRLNHQIYQNSPREKYVTLFAGVFDAPRRMLHFCNAGHLPPVLVDQAGVTRLEAGGTVLGLFESARFQPGSVELNPGALLAVFTDGVTEAFNAADEEFGEERLICMLRDRTRLEPESIYREVSDEVRRWQGDRKQHDDITLIVAKGT